MTTPYPGGKDPPGYSLKREAVRHKFNIKCLFFFLPLTFTIKLFYFLYPVALEFQAHRKRIIPTRAKTANEQSAAPQP